MIEKTIFLRLNKISVSWYSEAHGRAAFYFGGKM